MSDALYDALIVEHDRAPRNHGVLAGATHSATLDNPLCGDVVTMHVIVAADRIVRAMFEARGCALCRAAGSLLTERLAGLRVEELRAFAARFEAFVARDHTLADDAAALGDFIAFRGVQAARSRRTCATLPVRAALAAIV